MYFTLFLPIQPIATVGLLVGLASRSQPISSSGDFIYNASRDFKTCRCPFYVSVPRIVHLPINQNLTHLAYCSKIYSEEGVWVLFF